MQAEEPYDVFPVINCGIDWLTCTSKRRGVSNALEDFGLRLMEEQIAGSGRMLPARRLGYVGRQLGSVFLGVRPADVMIQISGPLCTPLAAQAIALSTNVSRIDLQVTVWTEGEAADLARWTRDAIARRRKVSGERGALDLTCGWPSGDTLNINRRVSENYGRLYDKTVEASLGPARLVWRYEVEWKGTAARSLAGRLQQCGIDPPHVSKLVHAWYTKKGVQPAFDCASHEYASQPTLDAPKRDVLTWMRQSLSKTIAKSIAANGESVTLDALGLSNYTRRDPTNGSSPAL